MKHWIVGAISALAMSGAAQAADVMKMAVTTSFNNSGLADVLLPRILISMCNCWSSGPARRSS